MASLADHIDRVLSNGECLTAVEIFLRLDPERQGTLDSFTISDIVRCADRMPNLIRSGKEYCRKAEDTNPSAKKTPGS